jgi:hypothetical protein
LNLRLAIFISACEEPILHPSVVIAGPTLGGSQMWFYIQMWIPLLPIVYVVSCAIDQQTKPHVWWPPDVKSFFA